MIPDDFDAPASIREPRAELRSAAAHMRELYLALTGEGFTEHQALRILGAMIAGQRPSD